MESTIEQIKKPTQKINNVKQRLLFLSPAVEAGIEREANKDDFDALDEKALGKGGFGHVWKVRHKTTLKVYAIKVMNKSFIIKEKMVDQINREIKIMYSLHHPHIIKLYSHYEDDENFYLVMNCAMKGQLYNLLKRSNKRLDERTAAQYIREVISAVKYLHSLKPPVIHRDIKPENVLLNAEGYSMLADFGWSNFNEDNTIRDTYCGTPEYLAPEMISKTGHNEKIDIWSIGVLTFELIAGKPPFAFNKDHKSLYNEINSLKIKWTEDFPALAKNFVSKIIKLKPEERPTLTEMLAHPWLTNIPLIRELLEPVEMSAEEKIRSHLIQSTEEVIEKEEKKIKDQLSVRRESIRNIPITNSIEEEILLLNQKVNNLNEEVLKKDKTIQELTEKLRKVLCDDENSVVKFRQNEKLDLLTELESKNQRNIQVEADMSMLKTENEQNQKKIKRLQTKLEDIREKLENSEKQYNEEIKKSQSAIEEKDIELLFMEKKLRMMELSSVEKKEGTDNEADNILSIINIYMKEIRELAISKMKSLEKKLIDKEEEFANFRIETSKKYDAEIEYVTSSIREKFEKMLDEERILLKGMIGDIGDGKDKTNSTLEFYKTQLNELFQEKTKFKNSDRELESLRQSSELLTESKKVLEEKAKYYEFYIKTLNENVSSIKRVKDHYMNAFYETENIFKRYVKDKNIREMINFKDIN